MPMEILTTSGDFARRFGDCCGRYDVLRMAVAWCGDPAKTMPYAYLDAFDGAIEATVGTSFNQTHPDAFEWLASKRAQVRVVRGDQPLFHPKVYLFSSGARFALLAGSSNFTYSGFRQNAEVNVVVEGSLPADASIGIGALLEAFARWRTPRYSFVPTAGWLRTYRKAHARCLQRARKAGLDSEQTAEESVPSATWLQREDWPVYYRRVVKGLRNYGERDDGIRTALDGAETLLKAPWSLDYFKDIERRRVIGGIGAYAALGHIGASGAFLHLIANGTASEHRTIAHAMNGISKMSSPVRWSSLHATLRTLVNLGPTMKAWGRLLCITRPDLFCTIASTSLRANLSKVLGTSQASLSEVEGYVDLIRLIHSSPWFLSRRPVSDSEAYVWDRRVAYMDSIFY